MVVEKPFDFLEEVALRERSARVGKVPSAKQPGQDPICLTAPGMG